MGAGVKCAIRSMSTVVAAGGRSAGLVRVDLADGSVSSTSFLLVVDFRSGWDKKENSLSTKAVVSIGETSSGPAAM